MKKVLNGKLRNGWASHIRAFAATVVLGMLSIGLQAATYYVSPTGTPSAAGTEADPYDLDTAIATVYSGDPNELRFLPGTYKVASPNSTHWKIFTTTTFTGWGATRDDVVFDYDGTGRTFSLTGGGLLANLTISNFNCTAVNVIDGTMSNCVVKCGTAGKDGSVNASGTSEALIVDCAITGNTGSESQNYGIGLALTGTGAKALRCFVADNTYTGWTGLGGAGAYVSYGTIDSCTFSNNTATGDGGAVYSTASGLITNSTFIANQSFNKGGGAIWSSPGATGTNVIVGCTFLDNEASAGNHGGAIRTGSGFVVLSDCVFSGNSAAGFGGAVYTRTINPTTSTAGLALNGCTFTNNVAGGGGAVYLESYSDGLAMTDCTFVDNQATNSSGAGVLTVGPYPVGTALRMTVKNCVFKRNAAQKSFGGAFCATYDNWTRFGFVGSFTDCTFEENVSRGGSGVAAWGAFTNCTFVGNVATNLLNPASTDNRGAAVYAYCQYTTSVTVPEATNLVSFVRSTFTNNVCHGQYGAAVTAKQGALSFVDCRIVGNVSDTKVGSLGGAIALTRDSDRLFIDRCVFERNLSSSYGSAVAIEDSASSKLQDATIRNSLFIANTNDSDFAGALYMTSNCHVDNCTFIGNVTSGVGGAIRATSVVNSAVRNCLFYGNRLTWSETHADCDISGPATFRDNCVTNCCSHLDYFNHDLGNIVVADPLFVDAAQGNYRLKSKSPCVNAGLNQDWMTDAFDLAGESRLYGEDVDIGCYEYRPEANFISTVFSIR